MRPLLDLLSLLLPLCLAFGAEKLLVASSGETKLSLSALATVQVFPHLLSDIKKKKKKSIRHRGHL